MPFLLFIAGIMLFYAWCKIQELDFKIQELGGKIYKLKKELKKDK